MLAGGHSLIPLMKLRLAAPSLLVDIRKVPDLKGIEPLERGLQDRRAHDARGGRGRPDLGLAAQVAGTIADPQVRHRGTIGGSLAHGDPASDLPAVLLAGRGLGRRPGSERAALDRRRRPVRGLPHDVDLRRRDRHGGDDAGAGRLRLRLREVQPPRRGLGHGGRRGLGQGRWRYRVRRARRPHEHGLHPAAGDRGRGGAARRQTPARRPSRRRPSSPPRAPSPPATSTPRRTTSATSRASSRAGR